MAEWRERGYVPDSDDDENETPQVQHRDKQELTANGFTNWAGQTNKLLREDDNHRQSRKAEYTDVPKLASVHSNVACNDSPSLLSQDRDGEVAATISEPELVDPVSPIAEELERQLNHGLSTVQEVLRSAASPRTHDESDSTLSSPLSSLPPSMQVSPEKIVEERTTTLWNPGPVSYEIDGNGVDVDGLLDELVPRRALRNRNPIQIHPYMIDFAKHQQEFKDRGLKPVSGPQRLPEQAATNHNDETQDTSTFDSTPVNSSPSGPTVEHENVSSFDQYSFEQIVEDKGHASPAEFDFEEELPDISDVLQGRYKFSSTSTYPEERNAARADKSRSRKHHPRLWVPKLPRVDKINTGNDTSANAVFELPLSPPQSSNVISPIATTFAGDEKFRSVQTPRSLPAPIVSSDRASQKRPLVEISSSPEMPPHGVDSTDIDENSSSSSEEASQGIVQIRRRIKGVLPASWLKLDALQQKKTNEHKKMLQLHQQEIVEKGIAQRKRASSLSKRKDTSHDRIALPMDAEADQTSSESDATSKSHMGRLNRQVSTASIDFVMEDGAVEENTIDYMLAKRIRPPTGSASTRIRQTRLDRPWKGYKHYHFSATGDEPLKRPQSDKRPANVKSGERPSTKRRKRRQHRLELGVGDAPGLQTITRLDQPSFLKIAARTGKQSRTLRAQNPAQKFLQLATKEETDDINQELVPWQRRQTTRHQKSKPQPRQQVLGRVTSLPMQPRQDTGISHNKKSGNISPYKTNIDLDSLKQSTLVTLSRLNQNLPRTQNAEVSSIAQGGNSPVSPILIPGRVSLHKNRAGRGKFWSRISSRQAQVENIQTSRRLLVHPLPTLPSESTVLTASPPRFQATRSGAIVSRPVPTATDSRQYKSRKQNPHPKLCPRRDSTLTDEVADEDMGIYSKQSRRPEGAITDGQHLINLAIQIKPIKKVIDTHTAPGDSTLVGRNLFYQSLRRLHTGKPIFHSDLRPVTSLSTPLTNSTHTCTWLSSAMGAFIGQILDETWQFLVERHGSQDPSSSAATNSDTEKVVLKCLELLLVWFSQILLQPPGEPEESGLSLKGVLDHLYAFLERLTIARQNQVQLNNCQLLRILNRLLTFSTQLDTFDGLVGYIPNDTGHEKFTDLVTSLAENAMLFSLRPDSIDEVLHELMMLADWKKYSKFESVSECYPEIETIYCVCMLWNTHTQPHALDGHLASCIAEHGSVRSDQTLAYTVLLIQAMHLMLSYARYQNSAVWYHSLWAPWDIIIPPLTSFLHDYTRSGGPRMKLARELGLEVYRYCFSCVTIWQWPVSESLLKIMFKTYAEHDMTELFVQPIMDGDGVFNEQVYDIDKPRYGDTDFDIFLKMTALKLTELREGLANAATADQNIATRNFERGLRSMVSRLSPNNSRSLNEEDSLVEQDLIAMRNTYKLYQVLYTFAPAGYQPRLSQIESLTEFSSCHEAVRKLITDTWHTMMRHAIATNGFEQDITELGAWISRMIIALLDKLPFITTEVLQESIKLVVEERDVEAVVARNRQVMFNQILGLLTVWDKTLQICTQPGVARRILTSEGLKLLFKLLKGEQIEETVLIKALELVDSYLEVDPHVTGVNGDEIHVHIQSGMAQVLKDCMTTTHLQSRALKRAMIKTWFNHAAQHVKAKTRNWDNYLTSPANLSFPILADTACSFECSVLFLSFLVLRDENYLELDRETVYRSLLKGLLQPEKTMMFEYDLMLRLMALDSATLAIGELNSLFADVRDYEQGQARVVERRFEIIQHLIIHIWPLQFDSSDDSQDFIEPEFSSGQGLSLLRTITSSLKATWYTLNGEERLLWTSFAQAVILQLQTHSYKGFIIDPWFTDKTQPEFPKPCHDLKQFFLHHESTPRQTIDQTLITLFREGCISSLISNAQEQWCEDTTQAISCNNPEFIQVHDNLLVNVTLQVHMIQNVLPVYIEQACDTNINFLLSTSVLMIMRCFYETLPGHIYIDDTTDHYARWVDISLVLLDSIRKVIQLGDRTKIDDIAYRALLKELTSTASTILRGCHNLLTFLTSSGTIHPHEDEVHRLGFIIWYLLNDPGPHSRFTVADPFEPPLSEEDLAIREAVAADLTRSVANDWRQTPSIHQHQVNRRENVWLVRLDGVDKRFEFPRYVYVDVNDDFLEAKQELGVVLSEMEVIEPEDEMVGARGDAGAMPDPLSL